MVVRASQTGSDKNKFITGLTFVSININSIRGKKLELLAFLDFHQPQIVAFQETKIDSSISIRSGHLQTLVPCSRRVIDHLLAIIVLFP